jgi:glucose-1-phosphate thymidylyltransferase
MQLKGLVVVPNSAWKAGRQPGIQRVANRPILCHAVESLAAAGVSSLAVVAPVEAVPEIRTCLDADLGPNLQAVVLPQRGRSDILGALQAASAFVGKDPAIVHSADGLLGQRLELPPGELGDDGPDLRLMLHRSNDHRDGLEASIGRLLGLRELNGSTRLSLTGVCVFGPGFLSRAAALSHEVGAELNPVEVAERLAADVAVVEGTVVPSWRRYRGDPLDLLELNRIVLDQQNPCGEPFEAGDNHIEGRVIIHPSADVTSSVIIGPSIIGAEARVTSSYIGPYTTIGPGARIEGAEVVRSIVAEGAQIMHIGGRIEGSTIGRRATIVRGFSLPRALRFHVNDDVEVVLD